jgi:hypothetical protein
MLKRVWYFCSVCDVVYGNNEARVHGCGDRHCNGTMRFLEMTQEEYEQYADLLNEIGVKEFADQLRYRRGEFSHERHN